MRKFLLLLFLPVSTSAQTDCKDLYRQPDTYYQINKVLYEPVCGCDGFTYRNDQAAYWWGGINFWTPNTVCDDFDIDLYPNVSTSGATVNPQLRIYMKYQGNATLTIYNSFGNLMFEKLFVSSSTPGIIDEANPFELNDLQNFRRGIYMLVITTNGAKKYRKIIRITN